MFRTTFRTVTALLALPSAVCLGQNQRWNDRVAANWGDDAPKVSVYIDGIRTLTYNQPVRVRVKVSDDAYVVVGRVSSNGRLTILFPTTRTGRTFVRGNSELVVRGRQSGGFASFYANDGMGTGYVFALASYAPLDLSRFRTADFEQFGISSQFQLASRNLWFRPDAYIERFASWALFDQNVPYDYDVDYYSVSVPTYASASSLCYSSWSLYYDLSDSYLPYGGYCRNYFNAYLWCSPYSILSYYGSCSPGYQPFIVRGPFQPPINTPTPVTDSTRINAGVVRGGFARPDTVSRVGEQDPRTGPKPTAPASGGDDRPEGRPQAPRGQGANSGWDHLYSIPDRSLDNLKRSPLEAERNKESGSSRAARERPDVGDRGERAGPTRSGAPDSPARDRSGANGSAYSPPPRETTAEPPRRTGNYAPSGSSGSNRGADAPPPRETPRSYSPPPPRETPRSADAPPRSTGAPPARSEPPPQHTAPTRSDPPPAQPTKPSGTGEERKKPPM